MTTNLSSSPIIKISDIKPLFPQFPLDTIFRTYLNKSKSNENISINELLKTIKKVKGTEGLLEFFNQCSESFSKVPLVRTLARSSFTVLEDNYRDDQDQESYDKLVDLLSRMATNDPKDQSATQTSRKRGRDEDLDEKGGKADSEFSENQSKKIKLQNSEAEIKQSAESTRSSTLPVPTAPVISFPSRLTSTNILEMLKAQKELAAQKDQPDAQANKKRALDEDLDEKSGKADSESSEHQSKKIKLDNPESTIQQNTTSKPPYTAPTTSIQEMLNNINEAKKLEEEKSKLSEQLEKIKAEESTQPPLQKSPIISTNRSNIPPHIPYRTTNLYNAAEKEMMMNLLSENFPKVATPVLFLSLRHYDFDLRTFFDAYHAGKVNFIDIERRHLLEGYVNAKKRLDDLDASEKKLSPSRLEGGAIEDKVPHSEQTSLVQLKTLVLHEDEGVAVIQRFFENDLKSRQVVEIKQIQKVINESLVKKYDGQQHITRARGTSDQRWVFHGCASGLIQNIIEGGFDTAYSSFRGAAGTGIYFAQFPRTSLNYIQDCPPNEMKILLCRVELGTSTTLTDLHKAFPSSSISAPIRKPQNRPGTKIPYDSVNGNMLDDPNHPIFVVYENSQAIPEYIITFAIDQNRVVRGRPPAPAAVIGPDHPRYLAQVKETSKSIKVLERTLAFVPNNDRPDQVFLNKLHKTVKYGKEIVDKIAVLKEKLKAKDLPIPPALDKWILTPELKKELPAELAEEISDELLNIKLPKTLDKLQNRVHYYNKLCAHHPILQLPDVSTYVKLPKGQTAKPSPDGQASNAPASTQVSSPSSSNSPPAATSPKDDPTGNNPSSKS